MSTINDFKNAPAGATATHSNGIRAMKRSERRWVLPIGLDVDDEEMEDWGFTLDRPAVASAREALDLAWELAHEVKPWQAIPKGTRYIERHSDGMREYAALRDFKIIPELVSIFRTLEKLPDPEPDWLDVPVVLAKPCWCPQGIWLPEPGGVWKCARCQADRHWSELRDVIPLYPTGQEEVTE